MTLSFDVHCLNRVEEKQDFGVAPQRSTIAKQIWQPIDARKFGCVVSVRTSARTDSQGGEGSAKTTRQGVENAIFSWREIARCFGATGGFSWREIA